jgi:predicted nucleic acid-binding protein
VIVVDTSALVAFFLGVNHSGPMARKALGIDPSWAAPPHQPAELLNVFRGLVLGGKISQADAGEVLDRWRSTYIQELPFSSTVVRRIWELRHNVTAYDAAYVAVAEAHELALVTGDSRLAATSGLRCEIRLVR